MYHVNPTTGNAGICRAGTRDGCPFGTPAEHHENANDARAAFEARMSGETLQVHKKLYKPREDDSNQASSPLTTQRPPSAPPVMAPIPNRSKAVFEFDKADLKYQQASLLYREEGAIHNLDWADVEKLKEDRDRLAVGLGRPTIAEQESAERDKAATDRALMSRKLTQLRAGVQTGEVGPETNRGRFYNVERNLLHQYEMARSEADNPKDVWALKHSVSNYEVDELSKKLKDLGPVSFVSSRAKKDESESLKKQLLNASKIRDDAASALGLPQ